MVSGRGIAEIIGIKYLTKHLENVHDMQVKMKKQMECVEIRMQPPDQDQDV